MESICVDEDARDWFELIAVAVDTRVQGDGVIKIK